MVFFGCWSLAVVDHPHPLRMSGRHPQTAKLNHELQLAFSINTGSVPYFPFADFRHLPKKRRRLKDFFAVIIGFICGQLICFIIGMVLMILFSTENGNLPKNVLLTLHMIAALFSGLISASLVTKNGWLFGMLTQIFNLLIAGSMFGFLGYSALLDENVKIPLDLLLLDPGIRLIVLPIICATVAGYIADKYRSKILSFLGLILVSIGGGVGCLSTLSFILTEIYFVYLAGKLIFDNGKILRGITTFFLGSIASYVVGLISVGVVMGGYWVFAKIFNIYAEDIGLKKI